MKQVKGGDEKMKIYTALRTRLRRSKKQTRYTDEELEFLKLIYSSGLSVKETYSMLKWDAHAVRYHFNKFKKSGVPRVSMFERSNILLEAYGKAC